MSLANILDNDAEWREKMGNKVHELGLLLDEEVEMLMQEADCKSVSGESKSAAAGGAAAGAGAGAGGAAGAAASK